MSHEPERVAQRCGFPGESQDLLGTDLQRPQLLRHSKGLRRTERSSLGNTQAVTIV